MRLALVAAGLCALFGCSVCPSPLCTAWLGVSVTAQPWQEGAYTLTVDGVDRGRLLTCTFGVPYDGAVPTVADVECNDVVRKAVDRGVKLVINTDSHHVSELGRMEYGVLTAQRGWAPKELVINTWDKATLLDWVSSHRNDR